MTKLMVDTRPLKQFATENLPLNSVLRTILVSEPDSIDREEFLTKIGVWLKLIRFDAEAKHK